MTFLDCASGLLSWYHTSVRYHLSVTSNILPILCSIHTRLGTWHLIHCTIIFGMLFLYGTWYFMKWKKSCLSHMPSLPHQSLISHHFLPFFHVIGMPSAAKWSLKTSRSLCDWPKGGTWPMCGTKIVHWLKILPFLSGLKTKVRLRRPNFIRTQNIPLRGLSGVLPYNKRNLLNVSLRNKAWGPNGAAARYTQLGFSLVSKFILTVCHPISTEC